MADHVVRESADIAARRIALGEQLVAFREAADIRQGQLALLELCPQRPSTASSLSTEVVRAVSVAGLDMDFD